MILQAITNSSADHVISVNNLSQSRDAKDTEKVCFLLETITEH